MQIYCQEKIYIFTYEKGQLPQDWLPFHCFGVLISNGLTSYENDLYLTALTDVNSKTCSDTISISASRTKDIVSLLYQENANKKKLKNHALAGNRTRASRVAGENSTTEPPVPSHSNVRNLQMCLNILIKFQNSLISLVPKFILLKLMILKTLPTMKLPTK